VGQRTPTETLFGIVAAFVHERTWKQADLARKLETTTETIRKRLGELQAAGFKLEKQGDHPHVYWSVPKDWFPGVLPFKPDEVPDLLRLLGRMRRSALRDRVLSLVIARLSNVGQSVPDVGTLADDGPRGEDDGEERWLAAVEDARAKKTTLRMEYYSTSSRQLTRRSVSVHALEHGPHARFVGTCHTTNELRRFRVSNVKDGRLDRNDPFRPVDPLVLERYRAESVSGFHAGGPVLACSFFVRSPECAWVAKNLPDERIAQEPTRGGIRFSIATAGVEHLARYVVGLGAAAHAETPELAAEVVRLARGALESAAEPSH
jgi:predicted DNA-binding transcriptional regulator YafY